MNAILEHVTLNSGHVRRSPRSEVSADTLKLFKPIVEAGHGEAAGLRIEIQGDTFTLAWEADRPAVRCVLSRGGAEAWDSALALAAAAGIWTDAVQPQAPWLAVLLLPGFLRLHPVRLEMLGDAERCVAWAMLECA